MGLSWRPPFTYAITKSHQEPFPFTSNLTADYILRRAQRLLATALAQGGFDAKDGSRQMVMGNMALSFAALEEREGGQAGIESFFAGGGGGAKFSKDGAVKVKRERSGSAEREDALDPAAGEGVMELPSSPLDAVLTFTCDRCGKTLSVEDGSGTSAERVARAEAGHADYHFARDLIESDRRAERAPSKKPKLGEATTKVGKKVDKEKGAVKAKVGREGGQQSLSGFFRKK